MNRPVIRSQHNGGARGKGQAIESDERRNHGWRWALVEVTPPHPLYRGLLELRPSHGHPELMFETRPNFRMADNTPITLSEHSTAI